MMRITRNMMLQTFLGSLSRLNGRAARAQRQVTSGRKVNRASDDPAAAARLSGIAAQLARQDRLDRSSEAGRVLATLVDSALGEISTSLIRARTLAVQGAGTDLLVSRGDLATEVDSLREQILSTIAVQKDGRFLTSGTQTDLPPFDAAGVYQGNNSTLTAEVAEGQRIAVVSTGADALQGAVDVPAALQSLSTALRNDDLGGIRAAIGSLDQGIDHLGAVRARSGAAINRIDAGLAHRLGVREALLREASTVSGAGLPDILVELQQVNQAREATLAAGARIAGPTLFDFLG